MYEGNSAPAWVRAIVVLNAAVFVLFGLAFLVAPTELARMFDIQLGSADAMADLRAMYGGLSLAGGALFIFGLSRESYFVPSLFFTMVSSLGLAFGRVYSALVSGVPSTLVLVLLATELVSFAWAFAGYRACTAEPFRLPRTA